MRYTRVKSHYRRVGRRGCGLEVPILGACLLFLMMAFVAYPTQSLLVGGLIAAVLLFFLIWRVARRNRKPVPSVAPTVDSRYIADDLRRAILERDRYQCRVCGSSSYLEMDHIIPLSKGGATSYENLQVLCRGCNLRKGNR